MSINLAATSRATTIGNLPAPRSQPSMLAAIARLRGMQPAPVAEARVLEVGCSCGRNLIPLAERYPGASFLGVDPSERDVAVAHEGAQAIALANIEFRKLDSLTLPAGSGKFDYIIASGVYPVIDEPNRDRLLTIFRDHLSPQGVAYLSYHTHPGWRMQDMIGAMVRRESRSIHKPDERFARARALLSLMQSQPPENNPYRELLKAEAALVPQSDDAALARLCQGREVRPEYFSEVVARAGRHDLQYLGDLSIGISFTDRMEERVEEALHRVADDPLDREQFRDVLRNRRFRQTLLCHRDIVLKTSLTPDALAGLYLDAPLTPQDPASELNSKSIEQFISAHKLLVSTAVPLIKAALAHLGEIWPDSISIDDLVSAARGRLPSLPDAGAPSEDDIARLRQNLLDACEAEAVMVRAEPAAFTTHLSERPLAGPWARWQAVRGEVVTNRRHETLRLDSFDAHVLGLLDGTNTAADILESLLAASREGRVEVIGQQFPAQDPNRVRETLEPAVRLSLERIARSALLIG